MAVKRCPGVKTSALKMSLKSGVVAPFALKARGGAIAPSVTPPPVPAPLVFKNKYHLHGILKLICYILAFLCVFFIHYLTLYVVFQQSYF